MAVLSLDDLSLEIAYGDYEGEWVYYNIWLRWQGEPVINDAVLKRHGAKRGYGAISACEHLECGILPLLRKVLETNESDYWEPDDPDVLLAVYTRDGLPFLPSKWERIFESPEVKAERSARDAKRLKLGTSLDDLMEIILFADVYNFAGSSAYAGDGICFRLNPTRAELQTFYRDLREEYVAFRKRHNIEALSRKWRRRDEAAWF